jgi:hypothetical protein
MALLPPLKKAEINFIPLMIFNRSDDTEQSDSQDSPPDRRVSSALDELDIPYNYDPITARFEVLCQLKNDRSQSVFIDSKTNDFMGIKLREISSPALESDKPFDSRTTNLLLRDNAELVHGDWCIHMSEDSSKHFAVFSLAGLASAEPEPLWGMIQCVAEVADDMENRLSGLDEF